MWMLGAVLGVLALAVAVGGVWAWQASGRRTREDRADVVHRPRMERVSGGDAADRALLDKFLILGGKLKCAVYDFKPAEVPFFSTNIVYKLRVRPHRAVPHYVVVSYPTDGRFNRKSVRQALDSFSDRLSIRHVETGKETVLLQEDGTAFGEVYKWVDGRVGLEMRHELFAVYLHCSEWYYRDEIELALEVCSPVNVVSVPDLHTPRLTL